MAFVPSLGGWLGLEIEDTESVKTPNLWGPDSVEWATSCFLEQLQEFPLWGAPGQAAIKHSVSLQSAEQGFLNVCPRCSKTDNLCLLTLCTEQAIAHCPFPFSTAQGPLSHLRGPKTSLSKRKIFLVFCCCRCSPEWNLWALILHSKRSPVALSTVILLEYFFLSSRLNEILS